MGWVSKHHPISSWFDELDEPLVAGCRFDDQLVFSQAGEVLCHLLLLIATESPPLDDFPLSA